MQRELSGIIKVGSDTAGQLLIIYSAFAKCWRKKWEYNEAVKREVLYNILTEFGIPKKLISLINMCLTETYSRVRVGKNLSDMFPIRNGLKQGDALSPLLCSTLR